MGTSFKVRSILTGLAVASCLLAHGQNISTYAGTGVAGNSGNGGPATAATFYYPTDIKFDGSGNGYIADYQNGVVRKVNSSGIVSVFAGGGFSTPANGLAATSVYLYSPSQLAVDGSGNVYITDVERAQVYKVNTSGILSIVAGSGLSGFSGDGGPATAASLYYPRGLAIDAAGNLYIADVDNYRVRMVNTSGIISTFAGNGTFGMPSSEVAATTAAVGYPVALAVDAGGNVYIAESDHSIVQKVTPDGIIHNFAGNGISGFSGDGGSATNAELYSPQGLGVDIGGNVYIAVTANRRVRVVNHNGIINTIAGNGIYGSTGDGGPAINAEFMSPIAIGFDQTGNCYVADEEASKIRTFQAVVGPGAMCVGSTFGMSLGVSGGTWSSTNSTIATVSATGLISALRTGIDTIQCTYGGGVINAIVRVDSTWAGKIYGNSTICYDQMDTLTAQTPGGDWSVVSGSVYFMGNGIFTPFATGLTVIKYSVSNACGLYSTLFPVNIVPMPPTGVITGGDSVCVNHTVVYAESQPGGIWGVSGSGVSVTASGAATFDSVGLVVLTYTVSNMCGTQTAYYGIDVLATADCQYIINGVSGLAVRDEDFVLSPNPGNGTVFVDLTTADPDQVNYTITNMMGANVFSASSVANNKLELNTGLPGGVYLVTAECNGQHLYKRIVIY